MNKFRVLLFALALVALLVAGCAGGDTAAPAAEEDAAAETEAVEAAEEAPSEEAAAVEGEVPRNRTMVVAHLTAFAPPEMWSPWALGGTWQNGIGFFYEPLVFADMLNGHEYPWLAESWEYNDDATELTYYP